MSMHKNTQKDTSSKNERTDSRRSESCYGGSWIKDFLARRIGDDRTNEPPS